MSDSVATASPPQKAATKKVTKQKKPVAHPKYNEMVAAAVAGLKERGGLSRQAILKYILKNFNVGTDDKSVNIRLKIALRAGVKSAALKQSKGTGATGSFRLGEVKKAAAPKKPKKTIVAKPRKATKPKSPKKSKSPAKKAVKPKKENTTTKTAKPKVKKITKPKSPTKKATKSATAKKVAKPAAAKKAEKPAATKKAAKPAAKKTIKPTAKKAAAKPKKAAKKTV